MLCGPRRTGVEASRIRSTQSRSRRPVEVIVCTNALIHLLGGQPSGQVVTVTPPVTPVWRAARSTKTVSARAKSAQKRLFPRAPEMREI
jgi:hypothetical protein